MKYTFYTAQYSHHGMMYDHAFMMQKSLLYFKGWVTHITNTIKIVTRADRPSPPPSPCIMLDPFLDFR